MNCQSRNLDFSIQAVCGHSLHVCFFFFFLMFQNNSHTHTHTHSERQSRPISSKLKPNTHIQTNTYVPKSIRQSQSSQLYPQTPAPGLIIWTPLPVLYKDQGIMGNETASASLIKTCAGQWGLRRWDKEYECVFSTGGCLISVRFCVFLMTQALAHTTVPMGHTQSTNILIISHSHVLNWITKTHIKASRRIHNRRGRAERRKSYPQCPCAPLLWPKTHPLKPHTLIKIKINWD